ncbi:hypothetical protein J2S74_000970 [Evansella vedderi]|uniref:Uncharacterized protein n=1 Tax=Evansella vedderi TaxID=38282 RepID=A0ABT9ZSY6_9BACI|nr:hypothetical protein [Evansella vedderi]
MRRVIAEAGRGLSLGVIDPPVTESSNNHIIKAMIY